MPRFMGRSLARAQALQLLFQAEANGRSVDDVLYGNEYALEEGPLDDYGRDLALGADGMRHELDAVIAMRSPSWSVSRMPAVDRNLLRMALYEMISQDEVAIAVSIDECVELAKAYGTDDSPRFVNGLLGRVADDLEAGIDVVAAALENGYGDDDDAEDEDDSEYEDDAEDDAEDDEYKDEDDDESDGE